MDLIGICIVQILRIHVFTFSSMFQKDIRHYDNVLFPLNFAESSHFHLLVVENPTETLKLLLYLRRQVNEPLGR